MTIVSFGIGMTYALEAAEKLAADGIEAEVIDLRTLRPNGHARNHQFRDENQSLGHG